MNNQVAENSSTGTTAVPIEKKEDVSFFTPEIQLIFLTWITFFLLLAVLYKYAWKPILNALDQREQRIRQSVQQAEEIRQKLVQLEETTQKTLTKAEAQARDIVAQSRQASVNASKVIEQKAREEAKIVIENAQREIHAEFAKARDVLKQESAEYAIKIAEKLLEENLDEAKNKALIDKLINEV